MRVEAGGETLLEHEEAAAVFGSAYLVELGPLDGLTEVTVASRCASCSFVVTWSVGVAPDVMPPAFNDGPGDVEATGHTGGTGNPFIAGYDVDIRLPAVIDEGPVVIRYRGELELIDKTTFTTGDAVRLALDIDGGDARRVCFTPSAVDVAGNEGELTGELCVDLDPAVNDGCASTPPALMFGLLALLARRRAR